MDELNEEFHRLTQNLSGGEPNGFEEVLATISSVMFKLFTSLTEAGFTESQAIALIAKTVENYL